ncbi:bifunctional DNA primase/polymerase [Microbispora sp. CA-135349]|uniref:bifunctional DNA primase/polymerase n=1 Tax=Microbispora sp. CA-135349 TaxID=3239953 RepID=UPI003D8D026F
MQVVRRDAGCVIGSASGTSPLGPGIDTRGPGRGGRGGYLVGPGSVVNGRPYVIERGLPIATLPGWLIALLTAPRPHRGRRPATLR